jgi:hypothetical protein
LHFLSETNHGFLSCKWLAPNEPWESYGGQASQKWWALRHDADLAIGLGLAVAALRPVLRQTSTLHEPMHGHGGEADNRLPFVRP